MHMTTHPRLKSDASLEWVANGNFCVALANQRAAIVIMSKFGRESFQGRPKMLRLPPFGLFPTATIRKRRRKS